MKPGMSVDGALSNDAQRISSLLNDTVRAATVDLSNAPTTLDADELAAFVRAYYADAVPDDLLTRSADDLAAAALTHLAVGAVRRQSRVVVQARSTSSSRAALDIVTDDMPFLVDSVTGELLRLGHAVRYLIHPIMTVTRDRSGRITGLAEHGARGGRAESWIHVDVIGPHTDDELRALETAMNAVLADVAAAVSDWAPMREQASVIAADLRSAPPAGISDDEVAETVELLEWLVDNHFTFLGYREYRLRKVRGSDHLQPVDGSGLGLLREARARVSRPLPPASAAKARERRLLTLTKASSRSTVHRTAYLDYVGVKVFNSKGDVVGERRFLGLLTSSAYRQRVESIPIIGRKLHAVLEASGFQPGSHSAKDLRDVIESFPRDELFQTRVEQILPVAQAVMRLPERRQTRLFLRRDDYGRFYSALVFLPRDRYSTPVRIKMTRILMEALNGESLEYSTQTGESLTRLEFVVRAPAGSVLDELSTNQFADLQGKIVEAARSWDDDLADALRDTTPSTQAEIERFADSMPPGYRASYGTSAALDDIAALRRVESVDPATVNAVSDPSAAAGIALRLFLPGEDSGHIDVSGADEQAREKMFRLKVYTMDRPISLSSLLPILGDLGMEVSEENTFDFDVRTEGVSRPVWIYDFAMTPVGEVYDGDIAGLFTEAVAAAWSGLAESDRLNGLVLRAGMSWRQVALLRAYVHYQRMGGMSYSKAYIQQALVGNAPITELIMSLFEVLFDPTRATPREADAKRVREKISAALADVASLEEDRILSAIAGTVEATLRTNYFQSGDDGGPREVISFKLDPSLVPDIPSPKPYREIWVYSPRFEGVHLRFGSVARGGLRWSDRREDMRTEILGLVKAQMVKNTVIVPTGAKGGFVPKNLPDPNQDREAWLAEGVACYRSFIRSLLQITDNRVDGEIVPPPGVVRRDEDDPYLVVAADKGTATFSDYANEEAIAAGFWLGDAFASGGSVGYDHKAMGITARGAWESVKRHFRELGVDTQSEDFTAVGIGDMSGDVFGNGMLLSEHIRLVAAFDHRHIFIDPVPDAAASYAERRRLFDLPRSSWEQYDPELISAGGGVWPRSAKSIAVSPQMRDALGISGVTSMTPNELITAILKAPVDLFWNGGIGTYVKSSAETSADVGDRANDAIRVDGADLRCKVVGEGGNLGFTQRGRIEFALRGCDGAGGKINTDAIDNSAGVDTSDHEVNIKILLGRAIDDGVLAASGRTALLASMTDEVGELVLEDNYDQNVTLQMEEANNLTLVDAHRRLMHLLEKSGLLDRELEFLPTDEQLRERVRNHGRGLTSPELSVVLAYAKILADQWILDTTLPDDAAYTHLLIGYFPTPLGASKYGPAIKAHPLWREIVATQIINRIINTAGATGPMRMMEETGASAEAVFRAQTVGNRVFNLAGLFDEIAALDNIAPSSIQTSMRIEAQRLVERSTRWMLRNAPQPIAIVDIVARYRDGALEVIDVLPESLHGLDRDRFVGRVRELEHSGVPVSLATRIASLPKAIASLDIVDLSLSTKRKIPEVTEAYFAISERLQLSTLLELIIAMSRDGRWRSMARGTLRDDLNAAHCALTAQVLATRPTGSAQRGTVIERKLARWQATLPPSSAQAIDMLGEILSSDNVDLASIVVAVQLVRDIVHTTTTTH